MTAHIPDELFAPLTEAVATALRDMAGVECGPLDAAPPVTDFHAMLPVTTAAGAGFLALALPEATAAELARRVLLAGGAPAEPDAAGVRDCAGEVVNVIAGQAKTLLYGTRYHFALSTPRVGPGPVSGAGAVLAFGSEVGPFALHVRLPV